MNHLPKKISPRCPPKKSTVINSIRKRNADSIAEFYMIYRRTATIRGNFFVFQAFGVNKKIRRSIE